MKLYYSSASPYARKVLVAAHETGRMSEIQPIIKATGVLDPPADLLQANPLAKVPILITDDGIALYDSPVICEFLDAGSRAPHLFPAPGPARWAALVQQALADGLLDAALLIRQEAMVRPEPYRYQPWVDGQMAKVRHAITGMESAAATFADVTIGSIGIGCALSYLDYRFGDFDWRANAPTLSAWFGEFRERPSMKATSPTP